VTVSGGIDPELLARRRAAVTRHPTQRGIDRVEVATGGGDRLVVTVYFLPGNGPAAGKVPRPPGVGAAQVRLWSDDGTGSRLPQAQLQVVDIVAPPDVDDRIVVTARNSLRRPAAYVLELVDVVELDPFFAAASITTGPVQLADFAPPSVSPDPDRPAPVVDYLARDFASFRRLMLDRLSTSMPVWRDAEPADVVQTVVEVLAYAADQLSYYQDAVATESYLGTARRRVSVRRHARLLDYSMHEGCNARAWIDLHVDGRDPVRLPAGTQVLTPVGEEDGPLLDEGATELAVAGGSTVFETTHDAVLHPALNAMPLYDWDLPGYGLVAGATTAALLGTYPDLAPGRVLLLRGAAATAAELPVVHPVRLTAVAADTDPLGDGGAGVQIARIGWQAADALPLALIVSTAGGGSPAVAHGNVVLADHGRTTPSEPLSGPAPGGERGHRARLARAGLTWSEPYPADLDGQPAAALDRREPARAVPTLTVTGGAVPALTWVPRPDLLASDRLAAHLVVEMEEGGIAQVRFGDGVHGRAMAAGQPLAATYRVGNGAAGNVGRGALSRLALPAGGSAELTRIAVVTNPLPAAGGIDPEPIEGVRLAAPHAFLEQRRCVVEDDFVAVAVSHPEVRRASAAIRWTGSWHTAVVVVDRLGGLPVDAAFRDALLAWFEPFRLTGGDIDVRGPRPVAVDIVVEAGVAAGHRGDLVERALVTAFAAPAFGDLTIGQPLYLSQVIAHAAAVPGVAWADVIRFQRRGQRPNGEIDLGVLPAGPQESLRLAVGDVSFLTTEGG
jgi:hypothetical protein